MCNYIKVLAIMVIIVTLHLFSTSCSETNSFEESLEESNKLLKIVLNENLPDQERNDAMINLTKTIKKVLNERESTVLSNAELESIFDSQVYVTPKKKCSIESNMNIRSLSYIAPPELCESSERVWTFIQWWDDENVTSQKIIDGGSELATDLIMQKINGEPVVTFVGYKSIYLPPPVFSFSLMLKNNKWERIDLWPKNIPDLKEYWYYEQSDELLIIDHVLIGSIQVKTSERGDGFYVYSKMNPRDKICLMFSDETLDYKLFESPYLLISSFGRSVDHINFLFDIEIEVSRITMDNLSGLNLSKVVDLEPYETFESLDDSKYMIAKADYLTKISECRTYLDAIQKSIALLKGAQLANEPRYQYLQAGATHKYYNLLQANLIEQRSMIYLMLEELPNYYLNQEIGDDSISFIEQFINKGFTEEEVTLFLEKDMTNEEIKAFEHSLRLFLEELSLDAYYTNEIRASLNEQLKKIDEILMLIEQAINELEELSF